MVRIAGLIPKDDYLLEVQLDNGSSIILNMADRLNTVRFALLKDKNFFRQAATDGNFIHWGDKIDISVTEVFQLAQK